MGKSLVQRFPGEDLETTLMAYPRLAKRIIDILASRLLDANRRIVELADKAVADDTGRKRILDLYACKSENVSLGCSNER